MPVAILSVALMSLLSVPLKAGEVYRLEGGKHYTDSLPPERVREGYTVLDKQGREVCSLPPAATPEELAAERRKAAELEDKQRLEREQAQRDAMLLQLYASEGAILAARDARFESLDSRREVLLGQMTTGRQRLELLEREDPRSAEIPALRRRLAATEETLLALQRERESEGARFAVDLERWRALKQPATRTAPPVPPRP